LDGIDFLEMATYHEKQMHEKQEPVLSDLEGLDSDGDVSITALVAAGKFSVL
jgi:hypothetical protein